MNNYLISQINTDQLIIENRIQADEIDRFSKSDLRWAKNKKENFKKLKISVGEIYQIDFGKNYIPEMSYEHRGLVIRVSNSNSKILYVLPIYSYNPKKHTDVVHLIDNPESMSDFYLLKSSEFAFLKHDSVLKLNDIRSISINRLLYKQSGQINPMTDTYKKITELTFHKCFPEYYYELSEAKKEIEKLKIQIEELSNIH